MENIKIIFLWIMDNFNGYLWKVRFKKKPIAIHSVEIIFKALKGFTKLNNKPLHCSWLDKESFRMSCTRTWEFRRTRRPTLWWTGYKSTILVLSIWWETLILLVRRNHHPQCNATNLSTKQWNFSIITVENKTLSLLLTLFKCWMLSILNISRQLKG